MKWFKMEKFSQDTLEKTYFLPLSWLLIGLQRGFLSIEDEQKWTNSVQAGLIRDFEQHLQSHQIDNMMKLDCVWLFVDTKVRPDHGYYLFATDLQKIETDLFKGGYLYFCPVSQYEKVSEGEQRDMSHSLIQTFRGCGIKMKQLVWCKAKSQLIESARSGGVVDSQDKEPPFESLPGVGTGIEKTLVSAVLNR